VQGFHNRFERQGGHFEHCNFFNKCFCTLNFLFIIRVCRFVELQVPLKLFHAAGRYRRFCMIQNPPNSYFLRAGIIVRRAVARIASLSTQPYSDSIQPYLTQPAPDHLHF
jgi:hypothetical protein